MAQSIHVVVHCEIEMTRGKGFPWNPSSRPDEDLDGIRHAVSRESLFPAMNILPHVLKCRKETLLRGAIPSNVVESRIIVIQYSTSETLVTEGLGVGGDDSNLSQFSGAFRQIQNGIVQDFAFLEAWNEKRSKKCQEKRI
jgi:hypothetical protein